MIRLLQAGLTRNITSTRKIYLYAQQEIYMRKILLRIDLIIARVNAKLRI